MKRSNLVGIGVLLLAIGAGAFFVAAPNMDDIRSGWGQLAIGLSRDAAKEAQMWKMAYYGGIVAMIMGAVSIVAGLTKSAD